MEAQTREKVLVNKKSAFLLDEMETTTTTPDEIEQEVLGALVDLDLADLRATATLLDLPVAETGGKNRTQLLKLVMRHLSSEEVENKEDQGLSLFLSIKTEILGDKKSEMIPENPDPSVTFKIEDLNNPLSSTVEKAKTKTEFSRRQFRPKFGLSPSFEEEEGIEEDGNENFQTVIKTSVKKDFKINGKIGEVGQKDKLSFSSLIYQISQARKRGYKEIEICDAVIKCMDVGLAMRQYLETLPTLNLAVLSKILRSHFQEQDATTHFTALSNAKQANNEGSQQFVIRMMSMRQKVLFISSEDPISYPQKLIQQKFLYTVLSGLRNNNIRNQLRPILLDEDVEDTEILDALTKILTEENEHIEKFKRKPDTPSVSSNAVSLDDNNEKKIERKENPILKEIQSLRADINSLSALRSDVDELQTRMNSARANHNGRQKSGDSNRKPKPRTRCPTCVSANADHCPHCFACGSEEHFRAGCKVNLQQKNN